MDFTRRGNSNVSDEYNDPDSDEVEGSFIILPGNSSPQLIEGASNVAAELNLNVFQLGQLQLSVHKDALEEVKNEAEFGTETGLTSSCDSTITNNSQLTAERELENASGNLNSVISQVSSCSTDSTASFEEANSKVTQLLEENMGLRVFVRELNEKQKKFLENCKELESIVAKSQIEAKEQEQKYDRSRSVIETLRAKVAELESKAGTSTGHAPDPQVEIRRLERQLEEKDSLLKDENEQIQELKELLRKMGTELSESKSAASSSLCDISSLQAERDVLSAAFEDSKNTIAKFTEIRLTQQQDLEKLQEKCDTLQNILAETKLLLQEQLAVNAELKASCTEKTEDIRRLVEKSESMRNHAEELERKMDSTVQDLENVKEQMAQIELNARQKIALLEAEVAEKNSFLTLMEEYKNDFEAERRDKIAMREAKVNLADQLTELQLKLETKEAELEELHRAQLQLVDQHLNSATTGPRTSSRNASDEFVVVSPDRETVTATGFSAPVSHVTEFECPICGKIFETQVALVTHAYTCGEVPERPLPARPPSPDDFP